MLTGNKKSFVLSGVSVRRLYCSVLSFLHISRVVDVFTEHVCNMSWTTVRLPRWKWKQRKHLAQVVLPKSSGRFLPRKEFHMEKMGPFWIMPASEESLFRLHDVQQSSLYSCTGKVLTAGWGFCSAPDLSKLVGTFSSRNIWHCTDQVGVAFRNFKRSLMV